MLQRKAAACLVDSPFQQCLGCQQPVEVIHCLTDCLSEWLIDRQKKRLPHQQQRNLQQSSPKLPRHLYPKHVELVSEACSKDCSDELAVLEGMVRGESKVHKKLVQNQ